MKFFANVLLMALISFAVFFLAYKFVPLSWFDDGKTSQLYGSTITTINGSDTISGSRTTINTNFSNLNTDKIEATQTTLSSLSTVGTITSGVWNGSIVGATWGGTGSSTLSQYHILLGSSTNPVGIVQGVGASGQFLTSQGANNPPAWQTAAIDQTANYNWTGTNLFKTFSASSTITFNDGGSGLSYKFPTIRAASSTTLYEDGNGNLTWEPSIIPRYTFSTTTAIGTAASTIATSTGLAIPSGFLTASSTIVFKGSFTCIKTGNTSATNCQIAIRNSLGNTFFTISENLAGDGSPGTNSTGTGHFTATMYMKNSLSSQTTFGQISYYDVAAGAIVQDISGSANTTSFNLAGADTFVVCVLGTSEGNATVNLTNLMIEVNK